MIVKLYIILEKGKRGQRKKGTGKKGTGYFLSRRMANRNCHSNKGFLKHLEIVEDRERMNMHEKM